MLSKWHVHAPFYAGELKGNSDAVITAVWDEDIGRGQEWAQELGCPFEVSLDTLLEREDVDAVCVCTPTFMHKEVMIKAARRGKHIFTEKVLAPTGKEAEEIADTVRKNGVQFCISFPYRAKPEVLYAKKAMEDGMLGRVSYVRVRYAHDGVSGGWLPSYFLDRELCGGGAMMDLGAHPMYLCAYLLGMPVSAGSVFTNVMTDSVEDNAVSILKYADGTIAVAESAFVSKNPPICIEISGTKGNLLIGGFDNGIHLLTSETSGYIVPQLGEGLPSAISQFISAVEGKGEIHFTLDDAVMVSKLMDLAYTGVIS